MVSAEESVDVGVPAQVAYAQWARVEEYPLFLDGVERVERLSEDRSRWTVHLGDGHVVYDVAITGRHAPAHLAWHSLDDTRRADVTCLPLSPGATRVTLALEHQPTGTLHTVTEHLGALRRTARRNLQRYKELLEQYHAGEAPGADAADRPPVPGA